MYGSWQKIEKEGNGFEKEWRNERSWREEKKVRNGVVIVNICENAQIFSEKLRKTKCQGYLHAHTHPCASP